MPSSQALYAFSALEPKWALNVECLNYTGYVIFLRRLDSPFPPKKGYVGPKKEISEKRI